MEASAAEVRFRGVESRLDASHRSVTELRSVSTRHETEIKVTGTEVREIREDIGEMKRELSEARKEQQEEMARIRRGLWTAAGTLAMFVVAFATLILQAAGS
jgi:predicted  nucleic acid-binding Zn-ribbon protein